MRTARRLRRLAKLIGMGVTVVAISQEMSKPEGERTWQGRALGIPYDFRPPTWERLREAYWNPDKSTLFGPRPFGVGWAVNFGGVWALLRSTLSGSLGTDAVPKPVKRYAAGLGRTAAGLKETAAGIRQTADAGTSGTAVPASSRPT